MSMVGMRQRKLKACYSVRIEHKLIPHSGPSLESRSFPHLRSSSLQKRFHSSHTVFPNVCRIGTVRLILGRIIGSFADSAQSSDLESDRGMEECISILVTTANKYFHEIQSRSQ
jgi:hypothetical protein